MPKRPAKNDPGRRWDKVPQEMRGLLLPIADALALVRDGDEMAVTEYEHATLNALGVAVEAGGVGFVANAVLSYSAVVGTNVKAVREEAGWTQARLAESMTEIGFNWKRITVAEAESNKRRISYEELCAFAALFSVTIASLLTPDPDIGVRLLDSAEPSDAATIAELVIGSGSTLNRGRRKWPAAQRIVRTLSPDARTPAPDLWIDRVDIQGGEA